MDSRQTTTHMQECGEGVEQATGVSHSETAGTDDRTNQRKPDLTAVRVSCQHQVETLAARPGERVRGMRQED